MGDVKPIIKAKPEPDGQQPKKEEVKTGAIQITFKYQDEDIKFKVSPSLSIMHYDKATSILSRTSMLVQGHVNIQKNPVKIICADVELLQFLDFER